MRCRPNDLAVVIRSHNERNLGKLVTVREPYQRSGWWWVASGSELHGVRFPWPRGAEVAMRDIDLQPIRDPGDDARDETLTWVDVPQLLPKVAA